MPLQVGIRPQQRQQVAEWSQQMSQDGVVRQRMESRAMGVGSPDFESLSSLLFFFFDRLSSQKGARIALL